MGYGMEQLEPAETHWGMGMDYAGCELVSFRHTQPNSANLGQKVIFQSLDSSQHAENCFDCNGHTYLNLNLAHIPPLEDRHPCDAHVNALCGDLMSGNLKLSHIQYLAN